MSIDRISISNGALERALQSHGAEAPAKASEQSPSSSPANDAITVSDAAKEAHRIASMVDDSRAGRLDAVRQAIANGTYNVSSEEIAKKLIESNTR